MVHSDIGNHAYDELRLAGVDLLEELFVGCISVCMSYTLRFQMLNDFRVVVYYQIALLHLSEDAQEFVTSLVVAEEDDFIKVEQVQR